MNNCENTREKLIKHYQTYPNLQIQDIFKFLHQSSFGCEHLVSSLQNAIDYIKSEYNNNCQNENYIEKLDGDYSRVSLSFLNDGLSADTLGNLFFLSAKETQNGTDILTQKLEIAKELIKENLLPFSEKDFENAVVEWAEKGYPAIHHSDIFRECYKPSYRVISNKYIPYLPLFCEIDKILENNSVTIAIEGGSASGKSTLGNILSSVYDCTVLHTDDFFLRPEQRTPERYAEIGGNIDRERFLEEVLLPLRNGKDINYRKFDCSSMTVCKGIKIRPKRLVVIEGAYSMHPEFEKFYDFSVFLDIDKDTQKERIIHRNTPQLANRFFNEWIPLEDKYFEKMNIKNKCDLIICNQKVK